MTIETRVTIPADHPALTGHFPGRAIVPGTLVLEEVLLALAQTGAGAARIVSARFATPIPPGVAFTVRLHDPHASRVRFECRVAEVVAVSGVLAREPA